MDEPATAPDAPEIARPTLPEPAPRVRFAPRLPLSRARAREPGAPYRRGWAGWPILPNWTPADIARWTTGVRERNAAATLGLWRPGCGWDADDAERDAARTLARERVAAEDAARLALPS